MMGSQYSVPTFDLPKQNLTFLSTETENFTYKNLYQFCKRIQAQFKNIKPGAKEPLLIVADSSIETVFLIAASFLLKIPILPIHPETSTYEIESVLDQVKPSAVYMNKNNSFELLNEYPQLELPEEAFRFDEQYESIELILDQPEQIAGYFLTSGSTGIPKIVPVKRRQVLFAASSSAQNFKPGNNKYWLLCLPLNHVGGINVIYRSVLYHSAIYLVASFEKEKIRELLQDKESFEVASMVPTMLVQLMEDSFFRVHFNFKAILLGGGPISMDLINRSLTRGLPIVCSYGMTETCAQIAANPMLRSGGMYIPKKSVGPVFEPNEIEIRNDKNVTVLYNESGHIWLKGPQIFDGYIEESINQNYFDDEGWFYTGDYGHTNRKGQLFIENRRTDLILTGGENVNPVEVEEILNSFSSIQESAVVGIPDKKWGQKVTAFLVLKENSEELNKQEIEKGLRDSLRSYKMPKEFIIISKLPRTATQKIKRAELIRLYKEAVDSR
ncbi:MAG: AMP-binding protein [Balneolaceae bacterium]|nr:AMP-binding protein [Balneolaceae bacterium]